MEDFYREETGDRSEELRERIVNDRIRRPELVHSLAVTRKRRSMLTYDGKLVIVAVDHPARGTVGAGGDPWAMANRLRLVEKVGRALNVPGVDGVLATPDVIEEILLWNYYRMEAGEPDVLSERLLIGSMNRAGITGSVFELDDFITGYTASAINAYGLDGGKLLLQLNLESPLSSRTINYCIDALNGLIEAKLPQFLEVLPLPQTTDRLVQGIGIASGLGASSAGRWLKVPMVENFDRVSAATTCPILLLGGGAPGSIDQLLNRIKACLAVGPNVRGVMIGRGVLFPEAGKDPVDVIRQLVDLVHG